ncbi:hypothetical protein HNQ50_000957 [Silvimonas terrae]|uniref:Caspase family p20 domain-containing protein n=1 Tax=Silvimonas terrae TaxID=300266 RepID=A0A840RA51_9NEIS|nr:caspase family protein [Silvimonas terrae]MBB5190235.1 hypothetical protein [Silvimonas terrae]
MPAALFRLVLTFAVLALMHAALAADPKRIALLIGNDDYDMDGHFTSPTKPHFVPDLKQPCHDIDLIAKPLKSAGFEVLERCNLKQADLDTTLAALKPEFKSLPGHSAVFVYYAGHGMARHGYTFTVPVMFQWDQTVLDKDTADNQIKFFKHNANDVRALFDALPSSDDIGVVVALDSCRDDPLTESVGYNEAVSVQVPPNTVVQYATTEGETTPDGGNADKRYANILAAELARGGDMGAILGRVQARMWKLYRANQITTYADTKPGPAFMALAPLPLKVDYKPPSAVTVTPKPSTGTLPKLYEVHAETKEDLDKRNVRLDLLWCAGNGEETRFAQARNIAEQLNEQRAELGLGRIQLKQLTEEKNNEAGYRVHRNIMRYDGFYANGKPIPIEANMERKAVIRIASLFPDAGFLPKPGIGVNGAPTLNYISAFVCLNEEPMPARQ